MHTDILLFDLLFTFQEHRTLKIKLNQLSFVLQPLVVCWVATICYPAIIYNFVILPVLIQKEILRSVLIWRIPLIFATATKWHIRYQWIVSIKFNRLGIIENGRKQRSPYIFTYRMEIKKHLCADIFSPYCFRLKSLFNRTVTSHNFCKRHLGPILSSELSQDWIEVLTLEAKQQLMAAFLG